jgi:hypothetical protein
MQTVARAKPWKQDPRPKTHRPSQVLKNNPEHLLKSVLSSLSNSLTSPQSRTPEQKTLPTKTTRASKRISAANWDRKRASGTGDLTPYAMMRVEDYRRQQQQLASIDPERAKSKAKLGRTRQDKTRAARQQQEWRQTVTRRFWPCTLTDSTPECLRFLDSVPGRNFRMRTRMGTVRDSTRKSPIVELFFQNYLYI